MSKSDGRPSSFANTDAEHAAMYEGDATRMRGEHFEQSRNAIFVHGIAVHRGKKTYSMNLAAAERGLNLCVGSRRRRVHHDIAIESPGMLAYRGNNGSAVTGNTGDQGSFRHPVLVELMHPGVGELPGIFGGQLPVEQRSQLIGRNALLLSERSKEPMREEMDVRVGDRERAPGCVDHAVSIMLDQSWSLLVGGGHGEVGDAGRERHLRDAGDVVHTQLLHHRLAIAADRLQPKVEHHGDLLARFAFRNQA